MPDNWLNERQIRFVLNILKVGETFKDMIVIYFGFVKTVFEYLHAFTNGEISYAEELGVIEITLF